MILPEKKKQWKPEHSGDNLAKGSKVRELSTVSYPKNYI